MKRVCWRRCFGQVALASCGCWLQVPPPLPLRRVRAREERERGERARTAERERRERKGRERSSEAEGKRCGKAACTRCDMHRQAHTRMGLGVACLWPQTYSQKSRARALLRHPDAQTPAAQHKLNFAHVCIVCCEASACEAPQPSASSNSKPSATSTATWTRCRPRLARRVPQSSWRRHPDSQRSKIHIQTHIQRRSKDQSPPLRPAHPSLQKRQRMGEEQAQAQAQEGPGLAMFLATRTLPQGLPRGDSPFSLSLLSLPSPSPFSLSLSFPFSLSPFPLCHTVLGFCSVPQRCLCSRTPPPPPPPSRSRQTDMRQSCRDVHARVHARVHALV